MDRGVQPAHRVGARGYQRAHAQGEPRAALQPGLSLQGGGGAPAHAGGRSTQDGEQAQGGDLGEELPQQRARVPAHRRQRRSGARQGARCQGRGGEGGEPDGAGSHLNQPGDAQVGNDIGAMAHLRTGQGAARVVVVCYGATPLVR
eukprot:7203231-Pyramimonas_sp.AAC.2